MNPARIVIPASVALLAGMVGRMGWFPARPFDDVSLAIGLLLLAQLALAMLVVAGALLAAMVGSALWLLRRLIALVSAHPPTQHAGPG